MKTKLALCLVAGALMLPAAGFAADADADSKRAAAREFVKDSVITTKVKAQLAKEKPSTLVKVSVETDKAGIVVLSGTAKTQADKERAEMLARQVKGVATVENRIALKAD
jgi:hyperosmotically inducible protein